MRHSQLLKARRFATASTSPVTYKREGDQPAVAPRAAKAVSKVEGITVATYDHLGPQSSFAIFANAGSRFDAVNAPGSAHLLHRALVRQVPGDNVARFLREASLRGNSVFTAVSREHIVLGSEFLRDDLVDVVPQLVEQFFNTKIESYEFKDAREAAVEQTAGALQDAKTQAFEKLHQVAFRTGLGNPLYGSEAALENLGREDLTQFSSKYITPERITVVGAGVDHTELVELFKKALAKTQLPQSSGVQQPKQKYFGGEARIEAGPESEAHYVIAFPAAGYTAPEGAAAKVVASLLGGEPKVQWGSPSGLLAQAAEGVKISAFSTLYADAGLVGVHLSGENSKIKQAAHKALAVLKSLQNGISEEQLTAAKKAAIIASEPSDRFALAESLAKQESVDIESVTASDVQKLAKSAFSAKPSIVAYGNLLELPYADEL
ncbi:Metalloenzyme, LuxS/M16 peptidase-like protein [Gorgonomyces haynaldii]|nr:Metalloenzyme, LuxS/M16 peptidase-like protein [Gorgonomyces haynaldii]